MSVEVTVATGTYVYILSYIGSVVLFVRLFLHDKSLVFIIMFLLYLSTRVFSFSLSLSLTHLLCCRPSTILVSVLLTHFYASPHQALVQYVVCPHHTYYTYTHRLITYIHNEMVNIKK